MKSVTVRLSDSIVDDIEAEARRRKVSKTDVIRERLSRPQPSTASDQWRDLISSIAGSVEGPADLSTNVKKYLKSTGYGRNRRR